MEILMKVLKIIIEKLLKWIIALLKWITPLLKKFLKWIIRLGIKMLKIILKKFIEIIKIITDKFLKNIKVILDKKNIKVIDKVMKIFQNLKNKIQSLKQYVSSEQQATNIGTYLSIFIISLGVLPPIINILFGVVRSTVIEDPLNYLIYRGISMMVTFTIIGFIRKNVRRLINTHGKWVIILIFGIALLVLKLRLI